METCYNYTGKVAYFSSDERKWINKVRRMKEQYPDQVEILKQPEENDGCIYARLPAEWMRMQPKRVVELSEEEKQVLRDRLARVRADAS